MIIKLFQEADPHGVADQWGLNIAPWSVCSVGFLFYTACSFHATGVAAARIQVAVSEPNGVAFLKLQEVNNMLMSSCCCLQIESISAPLRGDERFRHRKQGWK